MHVEDEGNVAFDDLVHDVQQQFYVEDEVVAHVPKKIHFEKIGETELRRTSNEILSVIKEGLDQPKELKPDILASKDSTIQVDGPKLHCASCLISASRDMVSAEEAEEVSGKAVGSTQQQLSVEILIHYKPITIFDPGDV
ncbi:hypothetical protein POM88_041198 [Heracleum sosnowskyi]|uniref:Uncharacterized protein n=1 Tax=Heracleum sosnowskyi TaxID=360622 RepID=A0AAD8HGC5_9APIA|nr:hypothetical protein POM88_041198 [Heracleum sosnowskyi]